MFNIYSECLHFISTSIPVLFISILCVLFAMQVEGPPRMFYESGIFYSWR